MGNLRNKNVKNAWRHLKMKLIFNIFKKVRDLKQEELKLQKKIKEAWEEFYDERAVFIRELKDREEELEYRRAKFINQKEELSNIRINLSNQKEELKKRTDYLDQTEKELDQREQDLNELQQKLNDQILKLGIVQGVNK